MTSARQRHLSKGWMSLAVTVLATGVTCLTATSAIATKGQVGHADDSSQAASTTVTVSTQQALVAAVASASPGTTISLNAGTYSGGLLIRTSGTQLNPIVIEAAGDGPVTLTANLPMPPCNASSPDPNRTLRLTNGASYWTIRGLNINGGIYISGYNALKAHMWFKTRIGNGDWQARRAVPGRGTDDSVAGRDAIPYLENQIGQTLRPSDGITIANDVITRKGIHVTMGRYGLIQGTQITDVACGTGPGIWFGTYSDGWTIDSNTVSRVANSTRSHYMQEGIRIDGASNYNLIENNLVTDLPGDGRALNTDQDASYNTFTHNTAQNVSIGYNDEMSGWGNSWTYNTVTGYRATGFAFRMMDNRLLQPSMDTSTNGATVRCNTASGTGEDLKIGASKQMQISSNDFQTITLSQNLRSYWTAEGNTWNGTVDPPPKTVTGNLNGC